MEKGISFLEGFGDAGQGDGFQADTAAVAPGAEAMTACALLRFDTFDLSGTLASDTKLIAGNMGPGGFSGWGIFASPDAVIVQAGENNVRAAYSFTAGDKPVGGRVLAVHMAVAPIGGGFVRARMFVNGTFVAVVGPPSPTTFGAGLMSIGADGVGTFEPFGSSADIPSARNGVAGVAYAEETLDDADIAEHYRQILEADDVVDGDFGWNNLWSVRRGLPDLELAGGDAATWTDEIGGAVLTRTQFNQQTPSMRVEVRPARLY